MKSRLIGALLLICALLMNPVSAIAQDSEPFAYDARIEGYSSNYTVENSMLVTTILMFVLMAASVGVMFIPAPRAKE